MTKFEIKNDIPRIIKNYSSYADAFGFQWNNWKKTQLDSFSGYNISEENTI